MCQTWTVFVTVSRNITKLVSIANVCVTMSVRRFGRWSAMIPPKSPSTSTGRNWKAATTPRMNGSPVSSSTSQLCATDCIHVPISETP